MPETDLRPPNNPMTHGGTGPRGGPGGASRREAGRAGSPGGDGRRLLLLALNRAGFLKPAEKNLLRDSFGDLREAFRLTRADLEHLLGRRVLTAGGWDADMLIRGAEADLRALTRGTIGCTFEGEDDFPPLLREIYDPPLLLFYRGTLPEYSKPTVGVVGTRRPTGSARSAAYRLGMELSLSAAVVISGLARGIDREAHRGCLSGGGPAAGVLGSGLDRVYPLSSAPLARDILKNGGALFSEYPPETPPRKHHFPARNRIISGLAWTVVVVQAPERSGALITADYALDQGRDLLVHRAGLGGPVGAGSTALAENGARVVDSGEDVLERSCREMWGGGKADSGGHTEGGGKADSGGHTEGGGKADSGGHTAGTERVLAPDPGRALADLMERELRGELRFHNGRYVRADAAPERELRERGGSWRARNGR